jgi:carbamoyltransferase
MKHILGVSAGFHDAALSLINEKGDIVFAGHSERYSKNKNDENLSLGLLHEVTKYNVQHIAYYERPWAKQLRQLYAGQGIEWNKLTAKQILINQIGNEFKAFPSDRISTHNHHLSHAAAGFQTSTFDRATVVVIDAIGEWDTISIWGAEYDRKGQAVYKKLWRQTYPHSIGLFYSAITSRIGLRPLDEEYITMGMAAWGKPNWYESMTNAVVKNTHLVTMHNNYHTGLPENFLEAATNEDIACAAQMVAEDLISQVMQRARGFGWSSNLVYMGGVALNCLANRNLGKWFDRIWIMPCPGDAGSSLGAAALAYGRPINWVDAYLGHNIDGPYPVQALLDELSTNRIAGVASGRAEFGPRALGNRSLLADPRGSRIKDQVNEIKRRQKFRPFAPVILEELVDQYFDMPSGFVNSRYMQVIASCRRPDLFPAIIHVDGTSRVQTVPRDGSGIRKLLEAWYDLTGCPMLLNTSLNIRGEPMVNDRADADRFEQLYGVKVFS